MPLSLQLVTLARNVVTPQKIMQDPERVGDRALLPPQDRALCADLVAPERPSGGLAS